MIGDLIKLYPKLYQLTAADLAKEAKILEVLEKHHGSNNGLRGAPSGDLKIWIYIFSRDGECVNVTVRIPFVYINFNLWVGYLYFLFEKYIILLFF